MSLPRRSRWARLVAAALVLALLLTTGGDWPTYLHDGQRSASSADEAILSPANAPDLTKRWSFAARRSVRASPVVVGGSVYVGAMTGDEVALDATSGAPRWSADLGLTINHAAGCTGPAGLGIQSTASVTNGLVYVGGGNQYWYALDAATGLARWSVLVGDRLPEPSHYNWSSPLIYNGFAYVGVASLCDHPLVQGQLLQINLATQQVSNVFDVVPAGQVGGSIWTSPTVDPATNTLYVSTGNNAHTVPARLQPYTVALLALDATTLALKDHWQVPASLRNGDPDWTTTPILFDDTAGRHLVAAVNKDGDLFALDRTNLAAGPVWQVQIARNGPSPEAGDASVSSAALGNGLLYQAGGYTTVRGVAVKGAIRALDPTTGRVRWAVGEPDWILAPLAYAHGLLVAGVGNVVQVLNAANGALLYSYTTGQRISSGACIANGMIYVGSGDGKLYAFGLPAHH